MTTQVTIAPGYWLSPPAAASYGRMRAAGMPAGITSAGRTPAEQAALFLANYVRRAWNPLRPSWSRGPFGDVRWWAGRRYVRVTAVQVAPPGSSYSRHEKGDALDLPDTGPRAWIKANGAAHGWFATVAGEPWHYEHVPSRDRYHREGSWFDMATEEELRAIVREEVGALRAEMAGVVRQEAHKAAVGVMRSDELAQRVKRAVIEARDEKGGQS